MSQTSIIRAVHDNIGVHLQPLALASSDEKVLYITLSEENRIDEVFEYLKGDTLLEGYQLEAHRCAFTFGHDKYAIKYRKL
ncbi:hypothetical protein [Shewanella sp. 10N.286.54.B9]|uniref:hypothetical protein n=1 Tax=Shewanella sp. 10N.286.54.B9 TaxID=3229719 RepID=UPI00355244EA